jgi:hypothetical protein
MLSVKKFVAFVALLALVLTAADAQVYDTATGQQKVICTSGCSGGGSSTSNITQVAGANVPSVGTGILGTAAAPSSAAGAGIVPVVSTAVESSHILKASAGNLYDAYVTTGATAGFLLIFNATSAPANGTVAPQDCLPVAANSQVSLFTNGAPPEGFTTGITAVFSSTGCFTQTLSATAFFHGRVQ